MVNSIDNPNLDQAQQILNFMNSHSNPFPKWQINWDGWNEMKTYLQQIITYYNAQQQLQSLTFTPVSCITGYDVLGNPQRLVINSANDIEFQQYYPNEKQYVTTMQWSIDNLGYNLPWSKLSDQCKEQLANLLAIKYGTSALNTSLYTQYLNNTHAFQILNAIQNNKPNPYYWKNLVSYVNINTG